VPAPFFELKPALAPVIAAACRKLSTKLAEHSNVPDSLATRTFDRAAAAMRRQALACLPEIVRLMRTLASRSSDVSVPELADIVQKDPVILTKVLAAANTLGYNPAAVSVTSVTQAIHVIGYERIRSLAMSLLLVEQSSRGRSAEEQREIAALALTTGCIAQAAAESRTLLNPEEAFVCGSLRHFGRVVMVTCMLDDYRAAQDLAQEHSGDDAFRQIFGLTPLELGHRLLEASELPEELLAPLRAVSPETLAALKTDPGAQMLALTDFAAQLAEMTLNSDLTAAAFEQASKSLAQRYANVLPGLADQTSTFIDSASQQLNHFVRTFQIKSLPPRMLGRLRNRAAAIDPAGSIVAVPVSQPSPAAPPLTSSPPPESIRLTAPLPFSWPTELERVSALAASDRASPSALLDAALESLLRGLNASEGLFFARQPSGDFELTRGRGQSFHSVRKRPLIQPAERTAFGVCIARAENVLIHRAADPKLSPYLPAWLPPTDILGAFVLFPIVVEGLTRALALAGWSTPRQITLAADDVRLIRQLLATAANPAARVAA